MRSTDLTKRSLRSLASAKARTLLTASAIGVGTFALTLTLAASNGAQAYVGKIISDNFDPSELIVAKDAAVFGRTDTSKPQEYDASFGATTSNAGAVTQIKRLDQADLTAIRAYPEVERVREDVSVNVQYLTGPNGRKYVGTVQAFSPARKPDVLAGSIPAPLDNRRVLLPEAYVDALGFASPADAVGKPVTLNVASGTRPTVTLPAGTPSALSVQSRTFTVAAVLKKPMTSQPGTELYLFVGDRDALDLNDITTAGTDNFHKYPLANVKVKNGTDPAVLKAAQSKLEQAGYVARSVKDTQDFLNQLIGVLQGIVLAFGLIAVVASVFGIINTMYISVIQRTREIGLMKALGMRNRDIGRLFRFEAALIGLIGGLLGSLLAIVLGTALNPSITSKLGLGAGTDLLIFRLPQIAGLIAILIVISTLAGYLPSRKAAKLDPIEALRTE